MALGTPKCDFFRRREGAQGAVRAVEPVGSETQGFGDPVRRGLGPRADDLPSSDTVVRTQAQPGGKVAGGRPSAHVQSDLTNHPQRRVRVHPINPGQVQLPVIRCRWLRTSKPSSFFCFFPVGLSCRRRVLTTVLEPLQLGLYHQVALGYLALVHPVQFQSLGQLEDVLVPPVALQTTGLWSPRPPWSWGVAAGPASAGRVHPQQWLR